MASSISGDTPAGLLQTAERKLSDIGRRLQRLPKNNEALLALLEELQRVLSNVYQAPPKSTKEIIYSVEHALKNDKLFRNTDPEIKLQLAVCYNELFRVMSPHLIFPDDTMKECFILFLFSFKYLRGEPEKAYLKAMQILKTMATLQTIVILTELEDHEVLMGVMFQRFFNIVRFNQQPVMIECMEQVMTSAIESSLEFSMDVLKPLLASVEKENKNIASWQLGKRIFVKNSRKLQFWLKEAREQIQPSVHEYDQIVYHLLLLADTPPRELPTEIFNELEYLIRPTRSEQRRVPELVGDDSTSDIQSKADTEEGYSDGNKEGMRVRSKRGKRGKKKAMSIADSMALTLAKIMQVGQHYMSCEEHFGKLEIKDKIIMEKDEAKNTDVKVKGSKKKKRNKGSASEKEQQSKQTSGDNLVNMRVKLWWPLDKVFYAGTIVSYDALTKKHKVLYDDDEEEILNLNNEIWEPFHEERLLLANRASSSAACSRGADQVLENVFECRLIPQLQMNHQQVRAADAKSEDDITDSK